MLQEEAKESLSCAASFYYADGNPMRWFAVHQTWQAIVIQAWEGRGLIKLIQEPESVSQRYKVM